MVWLRDRLPADAIVTNGAGNFAVWVHRFMRLTGQRTQLSPTSGSMGYGPPAAIMAKRAFPDRVVVCFAGDGDFLMNGQEFATAVQYEIPVVIVVSTTACTAPSACTRSATIRAGSRRRG
jgi:acetolactate synthase-1/2/3 large subunit